MSMRVSGQHLCCFVIFVEISEYAGSFRMPFPCPIWCRHVVTMVGAKRFPGMLNAVCISQVKFLKWRPISTSRLVHFFRDILHMSVNICINEYSIFSEAHLC